MTWMQFFNFFYYIYVLSDVHQKNTRRNCSIPHNLNNTSMIKGKDKRSYCEVHLNSESKSGLISSIEKKFKRSCY